jgi:hypothetical protein
VFGSRGASCHIQANRQTNKILSAPSYIIITGFKGHWQPKFLLRHLKEHENISRLAV